MERLDRHTDPAPVWDHLRRARGALAFDVGANIGPVATGKVRHFLCLAFEKVPAGGGTTIIRKIINIFDD